MLQGLIGWSLRNRIVTLFGAAVLLLAGGYAALTIPVDVFPDLTAPTVTVLTEAHGMAAEGAPVSHHGNDRGLIPCIAGESGRARRPTIHR